MTDQAGATRGEPPAGAAGAAQSAGQPVNAAFLLVSTGRAIREQAEAELRDIGLSLRHLSALGHLAREPGLSYSELARRAGITVQSMQATLHQLEGLGAVGRRTVPGRGRTAQLHLTDPGRQLLARAMDVFRVADRGLAVELGADNHHVLSEILLRLFVAINPDGTAGAAPPVRNPSSTPPT